MEWNVYYYNINSDRIKAFNIFDHNSFAKYVDKYLKKSTTKEELAEALKSDLHYYFWSKCEWELVIKIVEDGRIYLYPWVGCVDPESVKIDVTDEEDFDWKDFAEFHTARQIYGNEAKIDVFDQVMYKWDEFVDYMWSFKKTRKKVNK